MCLKKVILMSRAEIANVCHNFSHNYMLLAWSSLPQTLLIEMNFLD